MARLFVKADKAGQILSVVKLDTLPEGKTNPFYDDDDPNIHIVEIKSSAATFRDMEVGDIHTAYEVDTKKKTLKKKTLR